MNKQHLDFLGQLVAANSISSKDLAINQSNAAAADVVATMLEDAGMTVAVHDVPGLPGKRNVIAHAGPDIEHEGLLLAGHTDTVPCDPDAWDTDPFTLTQRNGFLHGLGACDMKGFFAIIAAALAAVDLKALRAPLRVWATAEEECGMEGAMHAAKTAPASKMALVGEPTGVTPVYGHKGALAEQVLFHGKSGHSSTPAAGANALEACALAMAKLRTHMDERAQACRVDDFDPPVPTLSFGRCLAGDSFNRIPDRCELWLDRRLLPGENVADARAGIHEQVRAAIAGLDGISVEFTPIVAGFEAILTPRDDQIVTMASSLSGKQPRTVAYATEAPFYAAAGMSVLVMGAGDIAVAHQPNECVAIDELDAMANIASQLVHEFCVSS